MKAYAGTLIALAALLSGCTTNSTTSNEPVGLTTFNDHQLYSPTGTLLSTSQLSEQVKDADIILVGEWHGHSGVHYFQTALLAELYQQNPNLALSMEQFTRDKQDVVNRYLVGEIGEQTLIKKGKAWPNYDSDYRPLVEFAKQHRLDVIAANAPRFIVRCVGKVGPDYLNKLPANERRWAARSLTLTPDAYQARFNQSMHHGSKPTNPNFFAAQTTWDDTMAESMVDYLKQYPDKQILHTAGRFHVTEGLGLASRITNRNPNLKVVMVTPVTNLDELNSDAPDYRLLVQALPPRYVSDEEQSQAFSHPPMKKKANKECEL